MTAEGANSGRKFLVDEGHTIKAFVNPHLMSQAAVGILCFIGKGNKPMHHEAVLLMTVEDFAQDATFELLAQPMGCAACGAGCACVGYADHALLYRCAACGTLHTDSLPMQPLFAQDIIQAAALRHYAIPCPYCQENAPLVGGSHHDGLFFICAKRCHQHFTRTIRRF